MSHLLSREFIAMCARGEFTEGDPHSVIKAMAEEIEGLWILIEKMQPIWSYDFHAPRHS